MFDIDFFPDINILWTDSFGRFVLVGEIPAFSTFFFLPKEAKLRSTV